MPGERSSRFAALSETPFQVFRFHPTNTQARVTRSGISLSQFGYPSLNTLTV